MPDFLTPIDPAYFPLVAYVLDTDIHTLFLNKEKVLTIEEENHLQSLIYKAKEGCPIPYLNRSKWFYKDLFFIDNRVLIPRNETNYVVEETLAYINKKDKPLLIADICTGSGCIGISLAKYTWQKHRYILSDISDEALEVCKINYKELIPDYKNVQVIKSDLLADMSILGQCNIDVLVSNPPYIQKMNIAGLEDSVKNYEPHIALDGGQAGYELTIKLLEEAKSYMTPESFFILIETDPEIAPYIKEKAEGYFPSALVSIEKDLYTIDRYIRILQET